VVPLGSAGQGKQLAAERAVSLLGALSAPRAVAALSSTLITGARHSRARATHGRV